MNSKESDACCYQLQAGVKHFSTHVLVFIIQ